MENLKRNRGFQPLSPALIERYRTARGPRKARRVTTQRRPRITLHQEEMPIYVIESRFNEKECERIEGKHPEWDSFVSYTPRLKRLRNGDHFLCITKLRGKRATFTTSRYVEHDRIPGVGTVACVKDGDDLSLARLAKHLKIGEMQLMRMKGLDVYCVAILRRDFSATLG